MSVAAKQRLADFLMLDLLCCACVLPFRLMTAVGLTQAGWDQHRPLIDAWRFGPLMAVCELAAAFACIRVAHSALRERPVTPAVGWTSLISAGLALTVRCMASPAINHLDSWGDWGLSLLPLRAIWLFAYSVIIVRQIALWREAAEARS